MNEAFRWGMSRRAFLSGAAGGLGTIALASMLQAKEEKKKNIRERARTPDTRFAKPCRRCIVIPPNRNWALHKHGAANVYSLSP